MTAPAPARRPRLLPAQSAAALGVVSAVSCAAVLPLSILCHQVFNGVVPLVVGLPSAAVGVLVARRQPGNPLGWVFLAIGLCLFIGTDGGAYAILSYGSGGVRAHHLPLGLVAALSEQLWTPGILLLGVVVLLFPDGRVPSRRWRWAVPALCVVYTAVFASIVATSVAAIAGHHITIDDSGGLTATDSPRGWTGIGISAGTPVLLVLVVCFLVRQAVGWHRSSGDRRQQLKWLASGAATAFGCLVLATSVHDKWVGLAWLGLAALPVSMGVAVLKYRLYDIDRIISRTLSYTVVTGLLVGVYIGLVLLVTSALPKEPSVAVAAATLGAAALFHPVRRRVQRVVDRRFNRARYDAERTVAAFASRLNNAAGLDGASADLLGTVDLALEPAHVTVWVRDSRP